MSLNPDDKADLGCMTIGAVFTIALAAIIFIGCPIAVSHGCAVLRQTGEARP